MWRRSKSKEPKQGSEAEARSDVPKDKSSKQSKSRSMFSRSRSPKTKSVSKMPLTLEAAEDEPQPSAPEQGEANKQEETLESSADKKKSSGARSLLSSAFGGKNRGREATKGYDFSAAPGPVDRWVVFRQVVVEGLEGTHAATLTCSTNEASVDAKLPMTPEHKLVS